MKITVIVEGKTEKVFMCYLRKYLERQLTGSMPDINTYPYDGRIPKGNKLQRIVANLLIGRNASDHVIALTDVYTGSKGIPDFDNAEDAKSKMRNWVGNEPRFHPHAAQYDFEAWLLPYWPTIQKLAKHNKSAPVGLPETVNHNKPPALHIKEIFETGKHKRLSYVKPRDASKILRENDLSVAISQCPELKAFVNTILRLCEGILIP
jgi:hypothetical protein